MAVADTAAIAAATECVAATVIVVDTAVAQAGQLTAVRDAADTLAAEHAVTAQVGLEAEQLPPVADRAAVAMPVVVPTQAVLAAAVTLAASAEAAIAAALAAVDTAVVADTGNLFAASPFQGSSASADGPFSWK